MTDADHRIRQVVAELVDSAPIATGPTPPSSGRRGGRRGRSRGRLALVGMLMLVVAGLVALSQRPIEPAGQNAVDEGTGVSAADAADDDDVLLSAQLDDDEWPLPLSLPDGFEYEHATSVDGRRRVTFLNPEANSGISISTPSGDEEFVLVTRGDNTIQIEGARWRRTMNGSWLRLADGIQFWGEVPDQELEVLLGSIRIVDETELPRPPLDLNPRSPNYEVVATTTIGRGTAEMRVMTDGVSYATQFRDSGGCCSRLDTDQNVAIAGGAGPIQTTDPPVGQLHGLVTDAVHTIEVHLKDGTVIETTPQDLTETFPINFFVVTVPVNDDPFDLLDAVIVFDDAGNEIGRTDRI